MASDPMTLYTPCGDAYAEFRPQVKARADIKTLIETNSGVVAKERALIESFTSWWGEHRGDLAQLPQTKALTATREALLGTFGAALAPVGLLDRYKVDGVIASWWNAITYDLKALAARDFPGLIDSWVSTIKAILEDEDNNQDNSFEHKLVMKLMPAYLGEISAAEATLAELEEEKCAFEAGEHLEEGPPEAEEGEEVNVAKELEQQLKALKARYKEAKKNPLFDPQLDELETEIKTLEEQLASYKEVKQRIAAVKKELKALRKAFLERLDEAQVALSEDEAKAVCMQIFKDELSGVLNSYVGAHRREVVMLHEKLWDKYSTSLEEIEEARDVAAARLKGFMQGLGYA